MKELEILPGLYFLSLQVSGMSYVLFPDIRQNVSLKRGDLHYKL